MRRIKKKESDLEGSNILVWIMRMLMHELKPDMDRDSVPQFVDGNCKFLHAWAEGLNDPGCMMMFVFEDDGATIFTVVIPKGEEESQG